VVVVCESCSTRFRIDDARIPAKGRLVRCSQCKATFVAMPANASFDETVQDVVAEVTAAGGAAVPEPATDLFDAGGEDLSDRRARPGSDDERWEFDETPRASAAEVESKAAFEEHSASDDAEAPLDEVGDPLEWDLLRESVEPAAREARFVEAARPAREAAALATAEPFLDPVVAEPTAQRSGNGEMRRSIAQLARLGLTTTAWVVLAAMAGAGVLPLFTGGAGLRAAHPAPQSFALADGEARGVHAVFVENAYAGTLLAIEGELSRPHADPLLGLRVHLVDGDGARLGDGVWAGVARPSGDLRELAPATLRSAIEASAAAVAPGGTFIAVFEAVPGDATGFELALERLPFIEEPPATPVGVEPPPAPGDIEPPPAVAPEVEAEPAPTAPAAGEPTASSPPASRPSSG
jgi:predicted Zn finger-like uncharacterized protein